MEKQEPGKASVVDQSPVAKASPDETRRADAPVLTAPPVHTERPAHTWRLWILLGLGIIILAGIALFGGPMMLTALNTVCTDAALVNHIVTYVVSRFTVY